VSTDDGRSGRRRGVALLVALAAGIAAALSLVDEATRQRIADNEAARLRARLASVLPESGFDNAPHRDVARLGAEALGAGEPVPVYRARAGERPVAAVLTVVAPDGYVDRIRLLVGVRADGTVIGVRAVAHRETPGLGDGIETARSDWIRQFDGARAGQTRFALARDGGDFDRLTGATITSRAVIGAVQRALDYFDAHREQVFSVEAGDNP